MPTVTLSAILQLIIGVGLLNVWIMRQTKRTPYRGGAALTLQEEFAAYQLPSAAYYVVGALKVVAGVVMLVGLWRPMPLPVRIAAVVVAGLMVGAIMMHVKIKDSAMKSVPAAVMLVLCLALAAQA